MADPIETTADPTTRRKRTRLVIWIVAVTGLVGGAVTLWEKVLQERFIPRKWGAVEPDRIYRSGQLSKYLVADTLESHHIKVVVDLTGEHKPDDGRYDDQLAEASACATLGIERTKFPLGGRGQADAKVWADAIAAIATADRAGKPVLVHCSAGSQRTGALMAMYRILVQKWTPDAALDEMESYGWSPTGDREMLLRVRDKLPQVAQLLVERGIIDAVPEPMPVLDR